MNILCRLGLHSWKPVLKKWSPNLAGPWRIVSLATGTWPLWNLQGYKCRRCRARKGAA